MKPNSVYVETGEVTLRAMDWGQNGPLVVVMHGGQRTSRSWDAFARGLSRDHWVIALDSRGQGESSAPVRGYSQKDRVRDLHNFCEALDLPPAIAVGHSGGAATVLLSAMQSPERFHKVFVIEPMLHQNPSRGGGMAERTANTRRVWPSEAELRLTLSNHPATRNWRADVLEDVVNHEAWHLPDGSVAMKWSKDIYNADDRGQDIYEFIELAPKLEVPVFLMYGTASNYKPDDAQAFVDGLRQPRGLQPVEGAAHNVYMDNPDTVEEAVRTFIAGD